MSGEPRRAGLLDLLSSSQGCQFVIPVYQRSYTWTAEREVKQYLSDLYHVLKSEYRNHFLGILIYLEKSIDFKSREFSIIDGQQRLTTTFLTLYAIKSILEKSNNDDDSNSAAELEDQFLTNRHRSEKLKYKLKPLVADDDVYRCIVENRFQDIDNPNSTVLKNYNYIKSYLEELIAAGYTANDILMALDKLYVVCVPISEEDNAQKIFESINATGIKLTAADLIRNFLLMNLESDTQDKYYAHYWKKIEDAVSSNSKDLEKFFRTYLAIKKYELVPKSGVYRNFVDWVNEEESQIEPLFKELLRYARIYNAVENKNITNLPKELQAPVEDFRKINSDIPLSLVMELYRLYESDDIDSATLGTTISSVNTYMLRRSICDMDSQNISKLFPTVLKKVLENCGDDYSKIASILNQELVGNTAGTSGSYMPTDKQMHESLYHANVYKRPALRIILDRLELTDNPAPVSLSDLSIEHLMPQKATDAWLQALGVDEETYVANLHRLGNLTLAAKSDNSKMSNLQWGFKNRILASTSHLTLNKELIETPKWTIKHIDKRTTELINRICEVFPYPDVTITTKGAEESISEKAAIAETLKNLFSNKDIIEVKKNSLYKDSETSVGYVLSSSKMYPEGDSEKYWFTYKLSRFEKLQDCHEIHIIFICRNKTTLVLDIPQSMIDSIKGRLNTSLNEDGSVYQHHIVLHRHRSGEVTLLLSRPTIERIDISNYVVAEINF